MCEFNGYSVSEDEFFGLEDTDIRTDLSLSPVRYYQMDNLWLVGCWNRQLTQSEQRCILAQAPTAVRRRVSEDQLSGHPQVAFDLECERARSVPLPN